MVRGVQVDSVSAFVRRAALFALFALGLYGALYAASERLVYQYAQRNRFYQVKTASSATYDYVILGASHAATFDFEDMNARSEEMTDVNSSQIPRSDSGPSAW